MCTDIQQLTCRGQRGQLECVCVCMYIQQLTCGGQRGQLEEVSTLLEHVCPKDPTQIVRLGTKYLYPLSYFTGSTFNIFNALL